MIISASRRTDIPAFYSDWFINRLNAGYLLVKNPMNPVQVTRVNLSPDFVDCVVFWTKNPEPLISRLKEISPYNYYFHFTLNPYDSSIEKNLPSKSKLVSSFIKLSDIIGPERIIWRYDPVFYTHEFDLGYHAGSFENFAKKLSGYTHRCMFSFLTPYAKCRKNMAMLEYSVPIEEEQRRLVGLLAEISRNSGIELRSCAMPSDFSSLGVSHGSCIDSELIEKITGRAVSRAKDPGQRRDCLCASSIDIGTYNTCIHGCIYCYANYNHDEAIKNHTSHAPASELLIGTLSGSEKITAKGDTSPEKSDMAQLKLF